MAPAFGDARRATAARRCRSIRSSARRRGPFEPREFVAREGGVNTDGFDNAERNETARDRARVGERRKYLPLA